MVGIKGSSRNAKLNLSNPENPENQAPEHKPQSLPWRLKNMEKNDTLHKKRCCQYNESMNNEYIIHTYIYIIYYYIYIVDIHFITSLNLNL